MSHELRVGAPYNPKRRTWPAAAQYNYRGGEHELLLSCERLSDAEAEAVSRGEASFALFVEANVILLLFRFGPEAGPGLPWSEAPTSMHLVPEQERIAPGANESRATLRVVLLDADTGIVKALRLVLLSESFTQALHQALANQLHAAWEPALFDERLTDIFAQYETRELVRYASHRTNLGPKLPSPEA